MRNLFMVSVALMLIWGCKGGGGSDSVSFYGSNSGGGGGGDLPPGAHTPEPMTIGLFGMGLAGLFAAAKRKKRN